MMRRGVQNASTISTLDPNKRPASNTRWIPSVDPKNPLVIFMAGVWKHIIQVALGSGVLIAILNFVLTAYAHNINSITNARYWFLIETALRYPIATGILIVGVITFALLCWRAGIAVEWDKDLDKYRDQYVIERVKRLKPDPFMPQYLPNVSYRRRDSDIELSARLQQLRQHRPHGGLGVCVIGIPMAGKTRMAWEAMRNTLGDYWLVRWPRERTELLPSQLLKGQRVVFWLDNLHDYANSIGAPFAVDIPLLFGNKGIRYIVIATCWQEDLWDTTDASVAPLINTLTRIRPEDIKRDEAKILYQEISKEEPNNAPAADFENRWDKRTPGSLIVGTQIMQQRFLRLPENAKRILWVMQLLAQAGFGMSVRQEIVAKACTDLFNWPERDLSYHDEQWIRNIGILRNQGFLASNEPISKLNILRPAADSYLNPEKCVIPPPDWNTDWASAWSRLPPAFETPDDFEALAKLGSALLGSQAASLVSLRAAEMCFKTLLDRPRDDSLYSREGFEATVRVDYGLTLLRIAEIVASDDNTQEILDQVATAERACLEGWQQCSALRNDAASRNWQQWNTATIRAEENYRKAQALKNKLEQQFNM